MEIKTCEEYVVNRVFELEERNEKLNELLADALSQNTQLQNKIDNFMEYFAALAPYVVKTDDYIYLNSHWIWTSDSNYDIYAELYEFLNDNFSQDEPSEGEDDS